jgi:transcriptional regulator with XRE-family HTH domain
MKDKNIMFGDKIRAARQAQKLTISELAKATGFSSGYISSVERGLVNPSLSALVRLTSVLDVDPGFLFKGIGPSNQTVPIVKENERLTLVYPASNIYYELLTKNLTTKKVEFLRIIIPPGKSSGPKPLIHEGEEYGLILKGNMELTLGDVTYKMGPEIRFLSTVRFRTVCLMLVLHQ